MIPSFGRTAVLIVRFALCAASICIYSHASGSDLASTPTGVAPLYSDAAAATQNFPSNTQFDVLTQHNDLARTGAAIHENILAPSTISDGRFGYLGSVSVEGKIYAQPLYVEKAAIACETAGARVLRNANIAYVATLENFVYAIDVDRLEVCWRTQRLGCGQPGGGLLGMDPQGEGGVRVGIVSTPVIDLQKSVLYAVTRTFTDGRGTQFFVNTIDTRTGALIARAEVSAGGETGCGGHAFNPAAHSNRPGLLLVRDRLFMAFGGTIGEDNRVSYHGFVLGFDVSNPARPLPMPRVFCTTPRTNGGGIWMSGGGLASDGSSIYFMTGNGAYTVDGNGIIDAEHQIHDEPMAGEYPNSFVKLAIADLALLSSYTDIRRFPAPPFVFDDGDRTPQLGTTRHTIFWARERSDADLGSGGVLLLGNRIVGGGKDGRLYALDTNGLLRVQDFQSFVDADTDAETNPRLDRNRTYDFSKSYYDGPNIHGGPVAWDVRARHPYIYMFAWSEKDWLKRFTFVPNSGSFLPQDARDATPANPTPSPHGSVRSLYKSMPGGMLSISANGTSNGIVWAVVEEPYPRLRARDEACSGIAGQPTECAGCALSNGKFTAYCDAFRGYVPGRLYAFAADDNGIGLLPLLWGDKRSAAPNNLIPRYSKFTPPTIAHGKVIVTTANDEVRFYGIRSCDCSNCQTVNKRLDDIVAAWNKDGSVSFELYPSTATAFGPHVHWKEEPAPGGWGDSVRWLSGDFDGDGVADLAAVWNDGGTNTLTVRRSTGSSFVASHWSHDGGWMDSTQWLAGDFDGDGLTDIAAVWNDNGMTTIAIYRSAGTHFEPHVAWAVREGGWSDSVKWVAGDFDGDGLTDIAAIWNDGGTNTITVRRSTGSSFRMSHWRTRDGGWMDSTTWLAGDFDGNGRSDLAAVWNDGGEVSFAVYLSTGLQFAAHTQWKRRDGGWGDSVRWVSGDFDGDGLTDIAAIWNDGGTNTITVRRSTRSSFTTSHWRSHDGGWMDSTKWLAGKLR